MTGDESVDRLHRSSSASMHEQLADRLRHLVAQLEADSRIPTEMELVTSYGVSRTTVRRAVAALVEEGLLVRRQGAGTFVAPKRAVHPLDQLRPFVSIFSSIGKYPEGRILRFEWTENPVDLKGLDANSGLIIRRLYMIDGNVQAMVDIALPASVGARISRAQIEEHPIYQVLQQHLGLNLSYGEITLASVGASAQQAEALGVAVGSPLLALSRTTYDKEGMAVEHAVYHLLANLFELRLTVEANGFEDLSYSFSRPGPELLMRTDPILGDDG
jgi:GntR family transcriptional regulator